MAETIPEFSGEITSAHRVTEESRHTKTGTIDQETTTEIHLLMLTGDGKGLVATLVAGREDGDVSRILPDLGEYRLTLERTDV